MVEIARELDIPAAEVYGTATFYSFLQTKPMGKYIIRLCKTISCSMKGKNQVLLALQDMLNIKIGQTTPDGKFTLLQTNCLGWCHAIEDKTATFINWIFKEMTRYFNKKKDK